MSGFQRWFEARGWDRSFLLGITGVTFGLKVAEGCVRRTMGRKEECKKYEAEETAKDSEKAAVKVKVE
jgi:hypothetical protein